MLIIKKVPFSSIQIMKKNHDKIMTAPMDDMWADGYILDCECFVISSDKHDCGYFAINNKGVLLDFYVENHLHTDEVFAFVLKEKHILSACVSTYDPIFYEQCMKHMKDHSVHTLLYKQDCDVLINPPFDNIQIIIASVIDLEDAARFFREKVDIQGDWIEPYLLKLIHHNNLILFRYNNVIIGTGGIRFSIRCKGFANVGITTSVDYRRIGLASYILNTIKLMCNHKNYQTICSTTLDNIGSQKTMEKCGYNNYHTIYTMNFK